MTNEHFRFLVLDFRFALTANHLIDRNGLFLCDKHHSPSSASRLSQSSQHFHVSSPITQYLHSWLLGGQSPQERSVRNFAIYSMLLHRRSPLVGFLSGPRFILYSGLPFLCFLLIIAHPPCTYLSNAGARWLYAGGKLNGERYEKGLNGKAFFMKFLQADCPRIAVENPIPSRVYEMPPCTQIIQPYEYGEPWSKKTCLWLKGLPPLQPTDIVDEHKPYCSSGSYSRGHDPKYKGASRRGGSAKSRSKTFPGVAKAMAEQWGVMG